MSRLLIYLSFLSLPGAEELGLLSLTYLYISLVLLAPVIALGLAPARMLQPLDRQARMGLVYCCSVLAVLLMNFLVGRLHGIPAEIWLARSVHLLAVPSIFLCFLLERADARVLFKDICVVGGIEAALVFIAVVWYRGEDEFRRATDIEGVIVYSVYIVCAAFYAIRRFSESGRGRWLLLYLVVLLAAALTGTRVLMMSIGLLALALRPGRGTLLVIVGLAAVLLAMASIGDSPLGRFNLGEDDNVITIISKIEELQWLSGFFLDNPILGQGFGMAYQVSVAASAYTYSHNMLLFYLGYSGLVGFGVALYPLMRVFLAAPPTRLLVIAVLVFYTSATTYTNLKHSLLLMVALLATQQAARARGPADRVSAAAAPAEVRPA